jgi:hypothetical protein
LGLEEVQGQLCRPTHGAFPVLFSDSLKGRDGRFGVQVPQGHRCTAPDAGLGVVEGVDEGWNGGLGWYSDVAEGQGGHLADVVVFVLEGLDKGWHGRSGVRTQATQGGGSPEAY